MGGIRRNAICLCGMTTGRWLCTSEADGIRYEASCIVQDLGMG